jgi:flagellin-specific chaperone FliS
MPVDRRSDPTTGELFDRAIALGAGAREALARGDRDACEPFALRLRATIGEIAHRLDHDGGPLGGHLEAIHHYVVEGLDTATVDVATLEGILADLVVLREARLALGRPPAR